MDRILYNALCSYYNALEKTGYMAHGHAEKLLVLIFIRDFVYNDYRGRISKEDYSSIERALDCLYGSTCLIPYPDYLKMGKLHLGQMTEVAHRLDTLERTNVLKLIYDDDVIQNNDSDIIIVRENIPPKPCDEQKPKQHARPCGK